MRRIATGTAREQAFLLALGAAVGLASCFDTGKTCQDLGQVPNCGPVSTAGTSGNGGAPGAGGALDDGGQAGQTAPPDGAGAGGSPQP